ncbi:MAG: STAS domain-containing protein [Thermodesulfobacteriota bacterium]|nr:STAS domain-containing protein [Thermodesulfobacteriota bacterium]
MPFKTNRIEEGTILSLKDEVTVAEAAGLKEALAKLMKEESSFALDVVQVAELDTSIIQLIFSALKTGKEGGVEISLIGRSDVFENAIERIGLNCSSGEMLE